VKIVFFGLSITSSWGNGHATTYRALAKGLRARGHQIVFFEQDTEWYADNRDLPAPEFCRVIVVEQWARQAIERELRDCDVAVMGSYLPQGPELIERVLASNSPVKAFYDIDTPITLAQLRAAGEASYLRSSQIKHFDLYFSFTGGPALRELESRFAAQRARPLYCSVDPAQYFRRPSRRYACDLSYMGTYAADRQPKIEELLIEPALRLPGSSFLVAGPQYPRQIKWPRNVRRIQHLNPRWHPHLYSSSRFTLNVTRREMVRAGFSPSVRLFEAAACAATLVSDDWPGLDEFFLPGKEILLPVSAGDVKHYLCDLSEAESRSIGEAAQERVLACHTHAQRAAEFEAAAEEARSSAPAHARELATSV
jgi:spore maturation protein CgeB